MTKLLNTYEQADFERLAAFYPYRDEHGLPVQPERDARNARWPYSKTNWRTHLAD